MNFEIGDVVIVQEDNSPIWYGIVIKYPEFNCIPIKPIASDNNTIPLPVWSLDITKLDETTYNNRRNELLQQLDELDAAFKLVGERQCK